MDPKMQYSCTSPKLVAKNLRKANEAMSDVGITVNPDSHRTLEFVEHKLGTTKWEKSNVYQVTDWKYIAEKERLRPGQYDAEPVRVEIFLDHFSSHNEATHNLVGHVYLLEDKHSDDYSVKSGEQVKLPSRKDSHLLNVQSLHHTYDAQFAGDGGVDLTGVYTSPSNRVVIFAISVWSYNYFSLRNDEYQFPFAYERWDLD